MSVSVSCKKVVKAFDGKHVLSGVDLLVEAGTCHVLLGPSGCGKTTLLNILAGLEFSDAGEVAIGGRLMSGADVFVPPEKRSIGFVFQDFALFPHLTVEQNVAFGVEGAKGAERVDEMLRLTELTGHRNDMPQALSGGERQRVSLARALAHSPDLVLLDEPFSNLDAQLRSRLRGQVSDILRALKTTAILVTHDHAEALALADEVSVISQGVVAQCASPQVLYRRPATRQVATLIGRCSLVECQVKGDMAQWVLGPTPLANEHADGPAWLLLRPEHIELLAVPHGNAVISQVLFCGRGYEVEVRVGQIRLEAFIANSLEPPTLGGRVQATVRGPGWVFSE